MKRSVDLQKPAMPPPIDSSISKRKRPAICPASPLLLPVKKARVIMKNTALGALPQAPQSHENDNGFDPDEAIARAEASGAVEQAARPVSPRGSAAESGGKLLSICASDVVPKRVEWLWQGRLAKGKHTLVAGEPSAGKSQVLAAVAALITTGGEWPCREGTAPIGNVVILAAEEGVEDTWVPRLMALGADLTRVQFVSAGRSPGERRLINLKTDLAALEAKVAEIGNVALIVIDPITAYIGDTDSKSNPKVRAVLDPLNEMVERLGTAIASITHFRKQGPGEVGGIAMHRFIDSIAFVASARVCLAVVADAKKAERRLLVPAKGNLSAPPQGLAL